MDEETFCAESRALARLPSQRKLACRGGELLPVHHLLSDRRNGVANRLLTIDFSAEHLNALPQVAPDHPIADHLWPPMMCSQPSRHARQVCASIMTQVY
jgi:hypothetical protein